MRIMVLKIKELRYNKGFSMDALAKAAGCSVSTVWKMENGDTNHHSVTLLKIATALGCQVSDIVEFDKS